MIRSVHKQMCVAALVIAVSASRSLAQAPTIPQYYPDLTALQLQRGDPTGGAPVVPQSDQGSPGAPSLLENWPRPSEIPQSLFRQAPVPMPYACVPIPGPYFEPDPQLDPPSFPQP